MKKQILLLVAVLAVVVTLGLLSSVKAYAQTYPDVTSLQPFTAESKFMSLPGYLRWQVFLEQGSWISRSEAVAVVNDEMSGAVATHPITPETTGVAPSAALPETMESPGMAMPSDEAMVSPSPEPGTTGSGIADEPGVISAPSGSACQ